MYMRCVAGLYFSNVPTSCPVLGTWTVDITNDLSAAEVCFRSSQSVDPTGRAV